MRGRYPLSKDEVKMERLGVAVLRSSSRVGDLAVSTAELPQALHVNVGEGECSGLEHELRVREPENNIDKSRPFKWAQIEVGWNSVHRSSVPRTSTPT